VRAKPRASRRALTRDLLAGYEPCELRTLRANKIRHSRGIAGKTISHKIMLSPKRLKYRKHHRGNRKGIAARGNSLCYGNFALQALEAGWLTSRQIEAGRRTISRYSKRGGKLYIRVFPDKPITMRPAETRMGSGKGSQEYWVAVIQPQRIIFEVKGISETIARDAFRIASYKMPVKTQFIAG